MQTIAREILSLELNKNVSVVWFSMMHNDYYEQTLDKYIMFQLTPNMH